MEADALTREVLGTSGIEEEALDPGQVRSSIASRLGMDPGKLSKPTPARVEGIVEITVDATGSKDGPMTKERLFTWHSKLFPEGRSGLRKVEAGAWRTQPVEVVSGPDGTGTRPPEGPRSRESSGGDGGVPELVQHSPRIRTRCSGQDWPTFGS